MYCVPRRGDHGLPHNSFKSCVLPRPIAWIATASPEGRANLVPYSQFQNLTVDPPYFVCSRATSARTVGGRTRW